MTALQNRMRRNNPFKGLVCLPSDNILREVSVIPQNDTGTALALVSDPLAGKVTWKIRAFPNR
jgi:hypothetical protein